MYPIFPMFPLMMGFSNDLTSINMKPVRLYRLMQSIVNFDREIPIPTKNLSRYARTKIFDFDYPLTNNIDKETFEVNILNHFINRRIGFETPTAFKIALDSKLNEIMPMYNNMFDMVENWKIFQNGDEEFIEETRSFTENFIGKKENDNEKNQNKTTTENENKLKNTSEDNIISSSSEGSQNGSTQNSGTDVNIESGSITKDVRDSNMPQSDITNVQDADYLTNYKYETDTFNNHTNNRTIANTESNSISSENTINNTEDLLKNESEDNKKDIAEKTSQNENLKENTNNQKTITENYSKRTQKANFKDLESYLKFMENIKSIYSLIYKDLDELFFQIY